MPFLMQTRSAVSIMYEKEVLEGLIATSVLMTLLFALLSWAIFKARQRKEQPWLFNVAGTVTLLLTIAYIYRLFRWVQVYLSL